MGLNWGDIATKGVGGIFGGIGEAIGKVAGKAAEWVPGPQQYRRNKIHELSDKMLKIQRTKPFDSAMYDKLRQQRDKLENESENTGN